MSVQRASARFLAALLVSAFVLGGGAASAADKRPLPASAVFAVDGAPRPLNQDAAQGQRLFVYVLPGSAVSTRLLDALRTWELPSLQYVTIVVGGARADAAAFAAADHGLPGASWLLDPGRVAWADLQLTGVPTLLGVKDGAVEWKLAGVLNDPSALKSVVTIWLKP